MEKIKKIMIIMIIIAILIVIAIIILLQFNRTQMQKEEGNLETVAFEDVEEIINKNLFFQIENNINTYYQYLQSNNMNAVTEISNDSPVILKNEYNGKFKAKKMYVLDKITNITVYVYGVVRKEDLEDEYYLIVNIDYGNNTFAIESITKEAFENAKNNKVNSKYKEDIIIQEKTYNKLQEKNITDFEVLQSYFEDFKYKSLYRQEEAFALIDNQYKEKKFDGNIDNYKKYVNNNIDKFKDSNILKYNIEKNGQFGTYLAYDDYNNYYKFIETSINNYIVILDNYTIEAEEYLNRYNSLSDNEKITVNIDKIFKLINNKEYLEIYNKYLNENFKNNYFSDYDKFELYMHDNFFDYNYLGNSTLEKDGPYYIVNINYKEGISSAAEERKIKIMIKLLEGTNFEISFGR